MPQRWGSHLRPRPRFASKVLLSMNSCKMVLFCCQNKQPRASQELTKQRTTMWIRNNANLFIAHPHKHVHVTNERFPLPSITGRKQWLSLVKLELKVWFSFWSEPIISCPNQYVRHACYHTTTHTKGFSITKSIAIAKTFIKKGLGVGNSTSRARSWQNLDTFLMFYAHVKFT